MLAVGARQAAIARLDYQLVRLKAQLRAERVEQERLQAELARLRSPERVDLLARVRLGMTRPERVRPLRVEPLTPWVPPSAPAAVAVVPVGPPDDRADPAVAAVREGALARLGQWLYRWLTGQGTAGVDVAYRAP